jgi:hypothetical protein
MAQQRTAKQTAAHRLRNKLQSLIHFGYEAQTEDLEKRKFEREVERQTEKILRPFMDRLKILEGGKDREENPLDGIANPDYVRD